MWKEIYTLKGRKGGILGAGWLFNIRQEVTGRHREAKSSWNLVISGREGVIQYLKQMNGPTVICSCEEKGKPEAPARYL